MSWQWNIQNAKYTTKTTNEHHERTKVKVFDTVTNNNNNNNNNNMEEDRATDVLGNAKSKWKAKEEDIIDMIYEENMNPIKEDSNNVKNNNGRNTLMMNNGKKQEELGLGFSHRTILYVSIAGFLLLSFLIGFVLYKSPKPENDDDENEDYDQKLERADVATLNRAQRRARAKHRMKKNRRIAPPPIHHHEMDDEGNLIIVDQDQQPLLEGEVDNDNHEILADGMLGEEEDPNNDNSNSSGTNIKSKMSRKERQKAAKALEKEEWRKDQALRQKQVQKEQQLRAVEEKRLQKQRQQQKEKEEQQKAEQLELDYKKWKFMFYNDDDPPVNNNDCDWTVVQFCNHLTKEKVVDIVQLFSNIPKMKVVQRIKELQKQNRLPMGMFTSELTHFVYISRTDANSIIQHCKTQYEGRVPLSDISKFCSQLLIEKKDNGSSSTHPSPSKAT